MCYNTLMNKNSALTYLTTMLSDIGYHVRCAFTINKGGGQILVVITNEPLLDDDCELVWDMLLPYDVDNSLFSRGELWVYNPQLTEREIAAGGPLAYYNSDTLPGRPKWAALPIINF